MALGFPETVESSHMGHPDFRVGGKIFATLDYPSKGWGMVSLTPAEQSAFMRAEPDAFVPSAGAWGRKGATNVNLRYVTKESLGKALEAAWRKKAGKDIASF